MITMIVRQGKIPPVTPDRLKHSRPVPDIAATDWNGQHYEVSSTHSALMELARDLVAAGCPDQDWEARGVNGDRRLFGKSLHRLAQLTIYEPTEGGRITIRPWHALSGSTGYTFKGVEGSPATPMAPE